MNNYKLNQLPVKKHPFMKFSPYLGSPNFGLYEAHIGALNSTIAANNVQMIGIMYEERVKHLEHFSESKEEKHFELTLFNLNLCPTVNL